MIDDDDEQLRVQVQAIVEAAGHGEPDVKPLSVADAKAAEASLRAEIAAAE